ncbi:hypothetical protein HRV97_00625 [Sphingomonas sp. HHU CXW]|uniref:Uncharacterized protein n=1 Tax=Sphingomonas hominis TaxID=2741495 RepID=A0ABX2JEG0_9SPHN|nr:hypothetical protein [Sphingomonas hominis]NTS63660.1 hypothetical protein [Sphingomonas hominis]
MRLLLLALLIPLAACGKGEEGKSSDAGGKSGGNSAAPAPMASPTGPPPKTPVMQVTPAPGKQPQWLEPRSDKGDPKTAPYGDLLNQPVVDAPRR